MKSIPQIMSSVNQQKGTEIREDNWTGTDFLYPGCRVAVNSLSPLSDGECRPSLYQVNFSVLSFAEGTSSRDAANLSGIVKRYLMGRQINYKTVVPMTRINVPPNGVIPPVPENERLWRGEVQFTTQLKDTS